MNKQDSNGVRNAQDIERKYDFAKMLGLKKNIETQEKGLIKINNELNKILKTLIINLKGILDDQSEISLWFYSGEPTNKNEPYIIWDTPIDHIGDIYYDKNTGYVYQLKGNLIWELNPQPDLVQAMALTNSEIDTSTDHERKVFFTQPTIPYSNGDWWIKDDGTLYICQLSKLSGDFESNDFIDSSMYTTTIAEKIEDTITVLKGCVTQMTDSFVKFTDLSTGGSTTIAGENIKTGIIQSNNYLEKVSGTKINLLDGTMDSKNFKLDENGNITSKNGSFESGTFKDCTINGGAIKIISTESIPRFIIQDDKGSDKLNIYSNGMYIEKDNSNLSAKYSTDGMNMCYNGRSLINLGYGDASPLGKYGYISVYNYSYTKLVEISPNGINAPAFNNNSLSSMKKNIEIFNGAIELIKSSDIYLYNWKDEEDDDKKHYGLVIGDKYNTPKEFISKDGKGIDTYSMVSICLQAIKEQQQEIEELKKDIKGLKEVQNDKNR